ncbi:GNAT family N-acetyltransferase [Planomicrobium sp. CPCC 101110]|uniref:GNAT family N-acetyltransferase n=1 Tax=Planomicrobium sp. CPCC 101110 TaxID=2599619 RepID=UPI0011B7D1B9|nr:GNAT family N-acetyltransferase [Planomicrobium sp. CPCC 101110]TWT25977.1 GNAT family N-acetyltransferase [Planomicrobium sp. CPCC 101110]
MKKVEISIRKMRVSDYEVMAQWLSTKEVLEFYGDVNSPFSVERVRRKYGPRINGDVPIHPYIVEMDKIPIGYIQQYYLTAEQKEEYGYPSNLKIYGIDQFIGVPELFNQGIGTVMIKKFVDFLYETTDVQKLVLDPNLSNKRAIRCYEKCGFHKAIVINKGRNWLMEINKRDRWQVQLESEHVKLDFKNESPHPF